MQSWKWALAAGAVMAATPLAILIPEAVAPAADHLDPPLRTDGLMGDPTPDVPADIADVFGWYTEQVTRADGTVKPPKFNVAMTFAGPGANTKPGVYDRDVLYILHISNDGDARTDEFTIRVRFADDPTKPGDNYGVQITGIPADAVGRTFQMVGPVETDMAANGVLARAGIFDDPFFFDVLGFRESRAMNTLRFDNTRDFFQGQNDTAFVIEIPRERIFNGNNRIDVWGESRRFGGNL